jgi:hypothetical protein
MGTSGDLMETLSLPVDASSTAVLCEVRYDDP